jgi:hypothetical protein
VTLVFWLLGSAVGEPEALQAIHGPRLERLLEELVDSPVRGFVYEASGTVEPSHLRRGAEIVRGAAARWRIPVEILDRDPADPEGWSRAAVAAARRLTGG